MSAESAAPGLCRVKHRQVPVESAKRPLMSDDTRCDKAEKMRAVSRERAVVRAEYDRAEFLLIAAIATHKAATCWVDYSDPLPPDDYLETIEATKHKIEAAHKAVERSKLAAEEAGVIVQAHTALIHL